VPLRLVGSEMCIRDRVREAETFCKKQKTTLIWFNARTSAVGFYKKMGYEIVGSEFEIKEVGPHFLMYKKI
jgi:hypothetical protein